MKWFVFFGILFFSNLAMAQLGLGNFLIKKYAVTDTIHLHTTAISPTNFEVKDDTHQIIPPHLYTVDFNKAALHLINPKTTSITVSFFKYPDFLTQVYSPIDSKYLFPNVNVPNKLWVTHQHFSKEDFVGDLQTYGNITRGITIGNQQGNVLNSGLDLQIVGKLSDNLNLRASIKDTNLPLQENGISQNIKEFDRVFMELFTDQWSIKAGDIDIMNQESYFLKFNKKITGAHLNVNLHNKNSETQITTSGALVRGKFTRQTLNAIEGNQGPYQLKGANGELNIIVLSNSEKVFVDGVLLKRGEQEDYTIDYQIAQIIFNTTFPISNSQRIVVEFQYNDRNYNRFITYNSTQFKNDRWKIGAHFYSEHDIKNQPLDFDFSNTQKNILANAGNDFSKMLSESAQISSYDQNRIQYKKITSGSISYFEYSQQADETLYNVQFSYIGKLKGSYILKESSAIGKIYEYVGPNLGDYEALILLTAPNKTQVSTINTLFHLNNNSQLSSELAYSYNDANLFSNIDDQNNGGLAGKIAWNYQKKQFQNHLKNHLKIDFIQQSFKSVERVYHVDFNRDWNLNKISGNQTLLENELTLENSTKNQYQLTSSILKIDEQFLGIKNQLRTQQKWHHLKLLTNSSLLSHTSISEKGLYYKNHTQVNYQKKQHWLELYSTMERNDVFNSQTAIKNSQNFQLLKSGIVVGKGDSTKVFHQIAYYHQVIDSVQNNAFQQLQHTNNYAYNGQFLKKQSSQINLYLNYKNTSFQNQPTIQVLNSRLIYEQRLFKELFRINSSYETSSGTTPQQNFVYVETEPGQGYFTYLGDLNNNNLKDFDEFEVAKFNDQASYLKVMLPSNTLLPTIKFKWAESFNLQFNQLENSPFLLLRTLSKFTNQTNFYIDHQQIKNQLLWLNPFNTNPLQIIQQQKSLNNTLYFNRGLKKYNATYEYAKHHQIQLQSTDLLKNIQQTHQISAFHQIFQFWQIECEAKIGQTDSQSDVYKSRNFSISQQHLKPGIRFIKDENTQVVFNCTLKNAQNTLGDESLKSIDMGINFEKNILDKSTLLGTFNWINHNFTGKVTSPSAYKILEGLQPGTNFTWSLLAHKKLNALLDLQISYQGRKNSTTKTIHIGNIQLRASF